MNITLTTPFAGKDFCFDDYVRGIKGLTYPKDKIDYYVCDNSNNADFEKRIKDFGGSHGFRSFTYYKLDTFEPKTVENAKDYGDICANVYKMYSFFFGKVAPLAGDFIFNVEDDVEVPPDSIEKLLACFDYDEKVASASGHCNGRRMRDEEFENPMVWNFKITKVYPFADTSNEYAWEIVKLLSEKPFGIEMVGATHWGCLMLKTDKLVEIGVHDRGRLARGVDLEWGYDLMKAGYYHVLDWSIKCGHWGLMEGIKKRH